MLNSTQFAKIAAAALSTVAKNGADFYGWKNAPEAQEDGTLTHDQKTLTGAQALDIMTEKLDGAYSERFIAVLGTIASLIRNKYEVRLVQFQNEIGAEFDADGWINIIVENVPIFHISPNDLNMRDISQFVDVLTDNTSIIQTTSKIGEFHAMTMGAIQPGLDLVEIAQEHSK